MKKVLLVDDEREILDIMAEEFELSGFQVHTAASGNQALELLADNAYHAVVCDNHMPNKTGLQVLKDMKMLGLTTSVFWLHTGDADHAEAIKELGGAGVFEKPSIIDDIITKINEVADNE